MLNRIREQREAKLRPVGCRSGRDPGALPGRAGRPRQWLDPQSSCSSGSKLLRPVRAVEDVLQEAQDGRVGSPRWATGSLEKSAGAAAGDAVQGQHWASRAWIERRTLGGRRLGGAGDRDSVEGACAQHPRATPWIFGRQYLVTPFSRLRLRFFPTRRDTSHAGDFLISRNLLYSYGFRFGSPRYLSVIRQRATRGRRNNQRRRSTARRPARQRRHRRTEAQEAPSRSVRSASSCRPSPRIEQPEGKQKVGALKAVSVLLSRPRRRVRPAAAATPNLARRLLPRPSRPPAAASDANCDPNGPTRQRVPLSGDILLLQADNLRIEGAPSHWRPPGPSGSSRVPLLRPTPQPRPAL